MEKLIAKQTVSNLTEAEAIKQAQEGDAAAFEFLYKAHCRRVYSLCLRMIKNPAEAEDLTQQAFLQLFRKIGTFRGESGFSTWLHRVTVNVVLMHLRRKKPTEILAEDFEGHSSNGEGPREHVSSDTSMLGAIERLNLMRAIRKLPAGYKKLFLMYDVIGYEHSEIAALVGCSTGCSKSQVHKARKRLRRLLLGETNQREPLPSASSDHIRSLLAWTGQHKGETNGEICIGAWRILRRMDLVATDGPSKGGWPCSGGFRPAGDGRRPHVCERSQLG
jgi:RNA polymerase sigma-70 factor, ECF subfamily